MRVYKATAEYGGGGYAAEGGDWIALQDVAVDLYYNKASPGVPRDLMAMIAHEVDHINRARPAHTDAVGYHTLNSQKCDGLSNTP